MNEAAESRVTVVIITHNSADVIGECIESLPEASRVIVVDNASADGSAQAASRAGARVTLLQAGENLGYGRAANLGLAQVETEFGLLLNPDVRLSPGAVEALVRAADAYQGAAILSPTLLRPEGNIEFGHRPLTGQPFEKGPPVGKKQPGGDCCVGFLSGAAMFFSMRAYREIGGFDENIFLYYEDDDLCLRARRKGFSLIHVHAARGRHLLGKSSTILPDVDWWRYWHTAWSLGYVKAKHQGKSAAMRYIFSRLFKYGFKAGGYRLLKNRQKYNRYSGEFNGMVAYLLGRQATEVRVPRLRPPANQEAPQEPIASS